MRPGRPFSLNDVKRSEICALLSAGLARHEAAHYVGCNVRTIRREELRNSEFRRAVRDAELSARLAPERLLRKAAGSHWRAAAWLLERGNPHRFGRRPAAACTPEEVEDVCSRLIEAALVQIVRPLARRRAYEDLAAAPECADKMHPTCVPPYNAESPNIPATNRLERGQYQ